MRVEKIGSQTLILGDCMSVIPELGKFDAVLTDPPYGIGEHGTKNRFGPQSKAKGFTASTEYGGGDWDKEPPDARVFDLITAQPAIIFGGNYFSLPPSSCWLVWHKKGTDKSSFADCELAWTNLPGAVRYFRHDWVGFGAINSGVKRVHRTQKPVPLMEWCLGFLPDARTILDPFAGSGTTLIACQRMGKQGTGIERDPDHFEAMCKRVEEATRQPDLFIAPTVKPHQEALL